MRHFVGLAVTVTVAAVAVAVVVAGASAMACTGRDTSTAAHARWGLAIHGGAGTIDRARLTPVREAAIRADLERALRAGHDVLAGGGASVDAVTAAIVVLEDSPYFNAGKGAVFNHEGINELDAAIMVSAPVRAAGAVAGVRTPKNPILLARAVMERSPHVMLVGAGADAFAAEVGIEQVPPAYYRTEERWQQLQQKLAEPKHGTVGAVARDRAGTLAAATSTGGMTNKRAGRTGDSPVIGAGTFADETCAVSATGHGEFFIRHAVAHDVCARARYTPMTVAQAAEAIVMRELASVGGEGGVIAIDAAGAMTTPFNTPGMYRGTVDDRGVVKIDIFRD